jgi:hypothetical protein
MFLVDRLQEDGDDIAPGLVHALRETFSPD